MRGYIQLKEAYHRIACEQALLFGQVKRASRERTSEGLVRPRSARFARPDRRACWQANDRTKKRFKTRYIAVLIKMLSQFILFFKIQIVLKN